jgi:hypothetical protein
MKTDAKTHQSRPFRVHALVPDFKIIDVWRFELGEGEGGFDRLVPIIWAAAAEVERSVLGRLRLALGRAFGWDRAPFSRPIPGCSELSVADRLPEAAQANEPSPLPSAAVRTVYREANEALYEVSNQTVHALLHLGWVGGGTAELAVYVKPRGAFSRLYMAAIWPARMVIYPALTAKVERGWREPSTARRAA